MSGGPLDRSGALPRLQRLPPADVDRSHAAGSEVDRACIREIFRAAAIAAPRICGADQPVTPAWIVVGARIGDLHIAIALAFDPVRDLARGAGRVDSRVGRLSHRVPPK